MLHSRMRAVAQTWSLPFRGRSWRGTSGAWAGSGTGSSIDFQDHRQYMPGDDPRHIDWQAYARSGHYSMKLYREEVSPRVEIVVDTSASMTGNESKRTRTLELLYFCVESALRSGSALRCHAAGTGRAALWPVESLLAYQSAPATTGRGVSADANPAAPPALHDVPWRQGSLRVVISDLLFAGSPARLLTALTANHGRGVVLAPFSAAEAAPAWSGNMELVDLDSGRSRVQNVTSGLLDRYQDAYRRHFTLWADETRRHRVRLARIPAEPDFAAALAAHAASSGAAELIVT